MSLRRYAKQLTVRAPLLIAYDPFEFTVEVYAPKSETTNVTKIAEGAGAIHADTQAESLGATTNPLKEVFCGFSSEEACKLFFQKLERAGYTVIIPA